MSDPYETARETREDAEDLKAYATQRAGVLRDLIDKAGKRVTFVDLEIAGETYRLLLDVNAWCDVEEESGARAPIQTYRELGLGLAGARTVRAIIRHALKTGGGPDLKAGPIVDRFMADYPFSVATGIAETALAAWLVGVAPAEAEA